LHVTFTLRRDGALIRVISARDMSARKGGSCGQRPREIGQKFSGVRKQ